MFQIPSLIARLLIMLLLFSRTARRVSVNVFLVDHATAQIVKENSRLVLVKKVANVKKKVVNVMKEIVHVEFSFYQSNHTFQSTLRPGSYLPPFASKNRPFFRLFPVFPFD